MISILISIFIGSLTPPLADANALLEANLMLRWQTSSTGDLPKIISTIENRTIIFDCNNILSCYEKKSGKKLWSKSITTPSEEVLDIHTISKSNAFVVITPRRAILIQANSGKELSPHQAFGLKTKSKTQTELRAQNFKKPMATKCLKKGTTLIGGTLQGSLIWHDLSTGFSNKSINLGNSIHTPPLDCENIIIGASKEGNVMGINSKNGIPIWKKNLLGEIKKNMSAGSIALEVSKTLRESFNQVDNGQILNLNPNDLIVSLNNEVISSSQDFYNNLLKMNKSITIQVLKNNKSIANVQVEKDHISMPTGKLKGLRLQEKKICFITTEDNIITAIDTYTGHIQWQKIFDKKIISSPLAHNGSLFVAFEDKSLISLNPFFEGRPIKNWEVAGPTGKIIGAFDNYLQFWDRDMKIYSEVNTKSGFITKIQNFKNTEKIELERNGDSFFLIGKDGRVARIISRKRPQ